MISRRAFAMSAAGVDAAASPRRRFAPTRRRPTSAAFMLPVAEELSVSGMADLGTSPCLSAMLTNMFHWPPSFTQLPRMVTTVRSSRSRSAVSRIASRK